MAMPRPDSQLKKISEEGTSKKLAGKGKSPIGEIGVLDPYHVGVISQRAVSNPAYYKKPVVAVTSHTSDSTTLRDALRAEDEYESSEAVFSQELVEVRVAEASASKQPLRGDGFSQSSRGHMSKIPTPRQAKRGMALNQASHLVELQGSKPVLEEGSSLQGSSTSSMDMQTLKKSLRAVSSSHPIEGSDYDQTSRGREEVGSGKVYNTHASKIPTLKQVKRGASSVTVSNVVDLPSSKQNLHPEHDKHALKESLGGEMHGSSGSLQSKRLEETSNGKPLPNLAPAYKSIEHASEGSQMETNAPQNLQHQDLEVSKSGEENSKTSETQVITEFGIAESLAAPSSVEADFIHHEGTSSSSSKAKSSKDSQHLPEQKECLWDTSLPPSSNQSPFSYIDNASFGTGTTSLKNSTSTNLHETFAGDDKSTATNNSESCKASERGDTLESGKSSLSRASDSSGVSDDSTWSNVTSGINKPHKANDPRWEAILAVRKRDGILGLSHFRLLKRLGCGDIGSVYLAELSGTRCYFAMKVMDKASLASRKKLLRAQTEREILQSLDHPFLPTLYTHFETEKFSCLVMEFCPGGDLHTLRQRQPGKHFSELAARFYAAEVLLALEYLHMLGVVYRDLKPENVLVREDGHIMLSDFDLSLRCAVNPTLVKSSSMDFDPSKKIPAYCVQPACIEPSCTQPVCVQPSCVQPSCFVPRLFHQKSKRGRKTKTDVGHQVTPLPELIAEPTNARSMSFVGTHEYLAPEIIKGEGHGSAVDWWTFGIFLHELIFGKTPFKGSGNRATLFNVVGQPLRFPESPQASFAARDLIRGLLVKEPQHRLAYKRGATEIKQHPFFEGVNWALIRCTTPPDIPKPFEIELPKPVPVVASTSEKKIVADSSSGNYLDFDFF